MEDREEGGCLGKEEEVEKGLAGGRGGLAGLQEGSAVCLPLSPRGQVAAPRMRVSPWELMLLLLVLLLPVSVVT